jgi:hypothetical protein
MRRVGHISADDYFVLTIRPTIAPQKHESAPLHVQSHRVFFSESLLLTSVSAADRTSH